MGRCRRADAQMRQSTAHYGPTMGSDYFLRQYNNENRAEPRRDPAAATACHVYPVLSGWVGRCGGCSVMRSRRGVAGWWVRVGEGKSVGEVNSSRIYGFLLWVPRTSEPLLLLQLLLRRLLLHSPPHFSSSSGFRPPSTI